MPEPTIQTKITAVYICQRCGRETEIKIFCSNCKRYIGLECVGNTYWDKWSDVPRDGDEEWCRDCWNARKENEKKMELKVHKEFVKKESLEYRVACIERILGIRYEKDGMRYFDSGCYLFEKYPE